MEGEEQYSWQFEFEFQPVITDFLSDGEGGYILSGYSAEIGEGSGIPYILKTDHRGNLVWSYLEEGVLVAPNDLHHFNSLAHEDRTFSLICNSADGLPGFVQKFGRDPHGVAEGVGGLLPFQTGLVAVDIKIFNGLGRRQTELVRGMYPVGRHTLSWDARGLPSGDYFVRISGSSDTKTLKIVLIK